MTQANSIPANPTLAIPTLASAAQPGAPQAMAAAILPAQAPPHPRPRQTAKFAKAYAAAWTLLAGLALAYMTTLAYQPSLLGDFAVKTATPDGQAQTQAIARFSTDLVGVKSAVGEIQKEVTALRSTVTASAAREKDVLDRLAAVEERSKAPLLAEAPAAPKTAAQRQAELRAQKAAERAAAAQAAAAAKAAAAAPTAVAGAEPAPAQSPAPTVTVLNPAPNPIATGSIAPPAAGLPPPPAPQAAPAVAAPPPTFGPGTIKAPAAAPVALELGTGPSLDALRLNWSLLSDRHGGNLKNLEARYLNAGEGQPYSLVAGPIASPEEAARVCAQLKAKQVSCKVTGFGGNAL